MENKFLIPRRIFGKIIFFSVLSGAGSYPLLAAVEKNKKDDSRNYIIYGIGTRYNPQGSQSLSLSYLNIKTKQINKLLHPIPGIVLQKKERITNFTRISDHSFLIATTFLSNASKSRSPNIFIFNYEKGKGILEKPKKITISDLSVNNSIEGVIQKGNDQFLMLVNHPEEKDVKARIETYNSSPNSIKRKLSSNNKLPASFRVLNQDNEGDFYAVSVELHSHHTGTNTLWKSDTQTQRFQKVANLTYMSENWTAGFRSIVCTPNGNLYGLGSEAEDDFNNLYEINARTGKLKLIRQFDVINIAV
ncbi:MAG: hypothetical protein WCD18_26605 [Thermosynechococcaceae cyanobacterium]